MCLKRCIRCGPPCRPSKPKARQMRADLSEILGRIQTSWSASVATTDILGDGGDDGVQASQHGSLFRTWNDALPATCVSVLVNQLVRARNSQNVGRVPKT